MQLIHMQVYSEDSSAPRGVSVWIETQDPAQARQIAIQALATEGWNLAQIDSSTETTADDYFRPCPSQQAFLRAQTAGVSWRFDDE
jgi:hypothetical protein